MPRTIPTPKFKDIHYPLNTKLKDLCMDIMKRSDEKIIELKFAPIEKNVPVELHMYCVEILKKLKISKDLNYDVWMGTSGREELLVCKNPDPKCIGRYMINLGPIESFKLFKWDTKDKYSYDNQTLDHCHGMFLGPEHNEEEIHIFPVPRRKLVRKGIESYNIRSYDYKSLLLIISYYPGVSEEVKGVNVMNGVNVDSEGSETNLTINTATNIIGNNFINEVPSLFINPENYKENFDL